MANWRPRGSALGYYLQCSMRALFDRAVEENMLNLTEEEAAAILAARQSSPYADLGTVIHYHTQVRLGATFHNQTAEQAAPTEEQVANAAKLFKGNLDLLTEQVVRASQVAMSAIGTGKWLAEVRLRRPWITGHVDLLDTERGELVDIKTTSKPPHYTTLSPTHLVQTLAYAIAYEEQFPKAVPITKVRVVYVDSLKGSWWTQCEYDPKSVAMLEYADMIKRGAKNFRKKSLYDTAQPNFASCEWCPYTTLCRDRYAVPRGDVHQVPLLAAVKASNPLKV